MVERSFEFFEDSSVLDEVSLHLWCDLVIEWELFNDEIEIVKEGLLDVDSDVVVQGWLNVEWLVRLLDLLDPHVESVKLLFDQVVEVVRVVEDTVD